MPIPQLRNYSWHVSYELDIDAMRKAASYLVGEHDFKSFCCVRTQAESTVRTIYSLEVLYDMQNAQVIIRITGNGFLYNMVRIIAGTLIDAGRGKINPDDIPDILKYKDRSKSGKTAPPQGLTLMKIDYV